MVATDQALLEALEEDLLDPAVIARTIEKAMAELQRDQDGSTARTAALKKELATVEAKINRVTQAIELGTSASTVPALVMKLEALEARRATLPAELGEAERLADHVARDPAALLEDVEETLADYRGLLARQTTQARVTLRLLLVDRVVYTPTGAAAVEFAAACSLGRILRGALDYKRWWPQRGSNPCLSGATFSPVLVHTYNYRSAELA